MPATPIPDRFADLLAAPVLGHLATVSRDGAPQVNPVWFIRDGDLLLLSVKEATVKYRNMVANPRIALSVVDPLDSHRYIELRGAVIDLELYLTLEWVDHLARKYTGANFTGGKAGQRRYKVTARIDTWTGGS